MDPLRRSHDRRAQIETLNEEIAALERKIVSSVRQDEVARRLTAIPGVGPITAAMVRAAVRSRRLPERKRLRCLDRLDPKVQLERRQGETRLGIETREPSAPLAIGRRCNGHPEAIKEWLCNAAVGRRPSAAASVQGLSPRRWRTKWQGSFGP